MVAPVFSVFCVVAGTVGVAFTISLGVAPTVERTGLAVATGTGVAVAATGEFEVLLSLSSS